MSGKLNVTIAELAAEEIANQRKRQAHKKALERDLEQVYSVGQKIRVVIDTPPEKNGGDQAKAIHSQGQTNKVQVFVSPSGHTLNQGWEFSCRVQCVHESSLSAIAEARIK